MNNRVFLNCQTAMFLLLLKLGFTTITIISILMNLITMCVPDVSTDIIGRQALKKSLEIAPHASWIWLDVPSATAQTDVSNAKTD